MPATGTRSRRTGSSVRSKPAAAKSGFSVKTFSGLNKKRMESKASTNFGKRLNLRQGDTVPVQFLQVPDDFKEYEIHSFREDGRWNYVPCLGDNCPLCGDEDSSRSKTSYRFCCNVYNLKEKKVQLVEGPKDLASRIFYRYSRKPTTFLKRTFEITKFPTSPVTYDVALADEATVRTSSLELHDLQGYLDEEAKRYYGDTPPTASSLDAPEDDLDDEAEDEDDNTTEGDPDELREELEDLTEAQLKARAKKNGAKATELRGLNQDGLIDLIVSQETGIDFGEDDEAEDDDLDDDLEDDDDVEDDDDLDDEDDEDDDDLEDEDDDDDEEEPPAPARRSAKKAPAKKAPAKRAAARRR